METKGRVQNKHARRMEGKLKGGCSRLKERMREQGDQDLQHGMGCPGRGGERCVPAAADAVMHGGIAAEGGGHEVMRQGGRGEGEAAQRMPVKARQRWVFRVAATWLTLRCACTPQSRVTCDTK